MKRVVEFVQDCADDRTGEIKPVDAKRAERLVRTGYARVVEASEAAIQQAAEQAVAPRGKTRTVKPPERRG